MDDLPVELLYEIQLYVLSSSLPHTSRIIQRIFKSAPPSFHAQYILGRTLRIHKSTWSTILRYPIATIPVLEAVLRHPQCSSIEPTAIHLPRRLFKDLTRSTLSWGHRDPPLPMLKFLYTTPLIPLPLINLDRGYALTKAVYASFIPLVRFLLEKGASPTANDSLAIMVAIRKKDLSLLRILIEREEDSAQLGKRRRLSDRLQVTPAMLKVAVMCDAKDIIEYLTLEKGCTPDLKTLQFITNPGHRARR